MRETYTRKLYYGKYGHRLSIKTRNNSREGSVPTGDIITWLLNRRFPNAYRGISSYSYDNHRNLYTVFFSDDAILDYLRDELGEDHLEEYERPMDDEHLRVLTEEKVVTRKSLFYDKYRVAIRVKCPWGSSDYKARRQNIEEMKAWCTRQWDSSHKNANWYVQDWQHANFYFKDPRDAMLFKLSNGITAVTERVVLLSELSEESA